MKYKYTIKWHQSEYHWDISLYELESGNLVTKDEYSGKFYWLARAKVPRIARKMKRKENRKTIREGVVEA